MQSLGRLGGASGVIAGIALAWLMVSFLVVLPATGLSLNDQQKPEILLPFIATHRNIFWASNILGGLLLSILGVVLFLALGNRFRESVPSRSQIGRLFGVIGLAWFGGQSAVRQFGFHELSVLYGTDSLAATHAFFALNGAVTSFNALANTTTGLGILILSTVELNTRRYSRAGYFGIAGGIVMILSSFVANIYLSLTSGVAAVTWLIWTGNLLWSDVS